MLPHPGTPRFLTLILSAKLRAFSAPPPPPTTLRFLCRPTRFSQESPNLLSEDRSLTPYSAPLPPPPPPLPAPPSLSLYFAKETERAKNLNSLLGLLIPWIDAEFRAQPPAPTPPRPSLLPLLATATFARPLFCSSFRVRPAATILTQRERGDESGRTRKSAVSIGTVHDSVGITTIDRASEQGRKKTGTTAATSKLPCRPLPRTPSLLPHLPLSPFPSSRSTVRGTNDRLISGF